MKFFIAFAGLAVALHVGSTGLVANEGRFYKGRDAEFGQFPFAAKIEVLTNSWTVIDCGGSLIDNSWVLTSAHCFIDVSSFVLYLGITHTENSAKAYSLKSDNVITHPNWNSVEDVDDIALVRIPFTEYCDNIAAVPLTKISSPYPTYVDENAIVMGWGSIGDSGQLAVVLQWASVKVISNERCAPFFGNLLTDNELCTINDDKASSCKGDSGGPLILESSGELIGVIDAVGKTGCENGDPSVYVRVSPYLEWIKAITGVGYLDTDSQVRIF